VQPILGKRICALESYENWNDLYESDRRRLDPQGGYLLAFVYQSAHAAFVCHLPVRRAEQFVPAERIRALRRVAGTSQERGEFYSAA
jgi:hypothetical protein